MQKIVKIQPSDLVGEVKKLQEDAYRLVAISCTQNEGLELTYSFDKEYDYVNLRLEVEHNIELDSISELYSYAFLYENEINELFPVKITGIALDFDGALYSEAGKKAKEASANE